ncbi:MAG: hypothetical protein K0S65_3519, partial [Labilithrix sp.]|nr:hypothetical protein [Labilithrix sp.]
GNGKPFTPVVLAKLGSPIAWDPKIGHDATIKVTPDEASGAVSATLTIPEGTPAGTIYLQIANSGDSDGSYDNVALAFTPVEGAGEETPTPPATTPSAAADTGCSTSNGRTSPAFFPGLFVAAAALTALRRRRSTAP